MGAIKLSNPVRAARSKGEEGSRVLGSEGIVGIAKREKGMICPLHMGIGIGTNSKKCHIWFWPSITSPKSIATGTLAWHTY